MINQKLKLENKAIYNRIKKYEILQINLMKDCARLVHWLPVPLNGWVGENTNQYKETFEGND